MLFSDAGKAVRFEEADVRPMGRAARGVRGMKLADEARVISMLVADDESKSVLTATENGYGKRTPLAEYPRYGRGTQGVIAIQTTERNGKVVGAALVDEQDEIMLVSTGGVLIRTAVGQISKMGRATQGVSLISLDPGTKLAGIEKIAETEDENGNGNGANGNGHGANGDGDDHASPRGNGGDHGG
jgi:DNA gyrase subunit A